MREFEHTDRAEYVTHLVEVWVLNDGDHYNKAREMARVGDVELFRTWLHHMLRFATMHTPAWHTAQELAPNDYRHDRIRVPDIIAAFADSE